MKGILTILTMAAITALPVAANATDFFFDDFEAYADDTAVGAADWTIFDTPAVTETGTTWTITNPGGRTNPMTIDGSATSGNFMISDSDSGGGSNPTDSGASHDLTSPSFSTAGAAGDVWLHVDTSAVLNNNGAAVYMIDVSTDGGSSFSNSYMTIAPGRVTSNSATTFQPDNTNADGYVGHLDVNLGAIGNQADVRVRFRHYEPNDDWWIAIDNLKVDDVAPGTGGSQTIFWEDFNANDGTLGAMGVYSGGSSTSPLTWQTIDTGGRYVPGTVDERNVNRLGHPTAVGPGGEVPFAIIDSDAAGSGVIQDEYLHTPILDLSGMAEVFLQWDDENLPTGNPADGAQNRVLLMQDDGDGIPNAADTVLSIVFDIYGGGALDRGEEPFFAERLLEVPDAAGRDDVYFAFHLLDSFGWWSAVDNVHVSGNVPEPSTFAVALLLGLGAVVCGLRKRRG